MLAIAHGYQIQTKGEDPLVTLVTQVADQFGEAAMPGTFIVDVFPFCALQALFLEVFAS